MKYLVTGGCGFIGSNFLHYMMDKYPDYYFVCLDALTYAGNYDNISDLENKKNFKFIHENICNKDFIEKLFLREEFDVVVNFAAESNVDYSISNPSLFYETNVIGTLNLLDACVMMNDKHKVFRFHQISTDEVYGDIKLDDYKTSFKETSILRPSSPYSSSKASADLLTLSYARTYGLNVSISRCSNNYGPMQNYDKLIPKTINNCLNDNDILVHGSGEYVRDWIYVLDHVRALDLILHNDGKQIYNVCSGEFKSNIEIINLIKNYLNSSSSIKYVENRPGQDLKYRVSSSLIKRELGFRLKYKFDECILDTIEWYKNI